MKKIAQNKVFFFNLARIGLIVLFFECSNGKKGNQNYVPIKPIATNQSGQAYVGYKVCMECHKDIVESHLDTAHFKTSAISNEGNIRGSFIQNENEYVLNDNIKFKMVSNEYGQFQEAYNLHLDKKVYSFKFDLNIGSGTKGQSYLTWLKGGLYQQQISYYTPSDNWINSPMYPTGRFVKPRKIVAQCIGCHVTYAKTPSNNPLDNRFIKDKMVLGIDCEKCHGPAKTHVTLARKKEMKDMGKNIVKFNNLNRQQRLDVCALCHSGLSEKTSGGILNYKVGDKLIHSSNELTSGQELDVHGNQYGLLIQSKCFKQSTTMDCITCHNVHENERGMSANFNQKCMNCHTNVMHSNDSVRFSKLDCIKCHMPVKSSKTLLINNKLLDTLVPLLVRSHHIKVY